MTLKFLYTDAEGRVCIVHALPKEFIEKVLGPLTKKQYRAHVLERSIPADATNVREITSDEVPTDRSYRNAWVLGEDKSVTHCPHKSKDILLAKVREERNKQLDATDKPVLMAIESGNTDELAGLKEHRQKLRDCTEGIKATEFKSLDEVKAAWPTILDSSE